MSICVPPKFARRALPHPITGEPLTIKSEVPKDMRVALKYLRQLATGGSRGNREEDFS